MSKRKDLKRDETMKLVAEGFSNKEIAELLDITPRRVANTKWEYNVINGTVNKAHLSDVVVRWLRPKNVKLPWTRVPNTRAKKGLVLCQRMADGRPVDAPVDVWVDEVDEFAIKTAAIQKLAKMKQESKQDMVNNPPHYTQGGIEVIDFIEAKRLGYNLGNVIKYVSRVDEKDTPLENLRKAEWYLKREIARRESFGKPA